MENRQPKIRFSEFQDDWEQRKLKEIADFNPKSVLPDKFEYVDLESVVGTEIIAHRTETKENAPSRAQRVAEKGDVFYQTVRPYQKNNYLFDLPYDNFVFSTGYAQLRPKVNSYFLLNRLQEEKFVKKVLDRSTGTSYPAINSNDLADIEVEIPLNDLEQSKIGIFFKQLDDTIALQQQELDNLKQTKQGFLQKIFPKEGEIVPEVRFPGFTEDWEEHKLQWFVDHSIIETPIDGNHGEKHPKTSDYVGSGIPFLMAKDIKNNIVDINNCVFINKSTARNLDKGFAKNDDILLTHKATIGQVGILKNLSEEYAVLTPQITYYRVINTNKLDRYFLSVVFRSPNFQKKLKEVAAQSTRPYIGITEQRKLTITVPSNIEEQRKIGDFFKQLDDTIALHQSELDVLKEAKKAFLQKMFI